MNEQPQGDSDQARSHAHAHMRARTRRGQFISKLSVDLEAQIGLEHEVTLQVAVLKAAGWSKREIIAELAIALVVYEMCEYRLRAITKEWTNG